MCYTLKMCIYEHVFSSRSLLNSRQFFFQRVTDERAFIKISLKNDTAVEIYHQPTRMKQMVEKRQRENTRISVRTIWCFNLISDLHYLFQLIVVELLFK